MFRALIIAALCAFATAAPAQDRPSTTSMACKAAQEVVLSRGAVVLGTGGETFDRFVRDQSFCPKGQVLQPAFAPSADVRQCQVAYRCHDESLPPQ